MNIKRLIFWGVLFSALLVYVVLFEQPEPEKELSTPSDFEKVLPLDPDAITRIDITRGGRTGSIVKGGNNWEAAAPVQKEGQKDLPAGVVSALTGAVNLGMVEKNPPSLEQFGLSDPQMSVNIYTKESEKPVRLLIGKNAPSGVSLYAMIEGENSVMLVGTYLTFSLNIFMDNLL